MDIDIDFKSGFDPNKIFKEAVRASMVNKKNELVKHPCGQYFQKMATDEVTGLAAIPYEEAEVLGYFKIDFLHFSALDPINNKSEIRRLINKEPNWDLLLSEENVLKLTHIKKHFALLNMINPQSVDDLADVLALIRPSKRYLITQYINNSQEKRRQMRVILYSKPPSGEIWFKRSHAISYALTIVLQMHLLEQQRLP
jgi:hypothetical protein